MEKVEDIQEKMLGMINKKAREIYSESLVEYGTNPCNRGPMNNPDGYAKITGVCGDTVEMFIRMQGDKIGEATFITDGCMLSTAACSVAAEMAQGKRLRDCIGITQSAILKRLEKMPADHHHCALLASMVLQSALRHYMEKNKKDFKL
jgi:NifU-like protein involved in Fe-S cluster formation